MDSASPKQLRDRILVRELTKMDAESAHSTAGMSEEWFARFLKLSLAVDKAEPDDEPPPVTEPLTPEEKAAVLASKATAP